MKRLALVAAVLVLAACSKKDDTATADTAAPAMAPAPAVVDTHHEDGFDGEHDIDADRVLDDHDQDHHQEDHHEEEVKLLAVIKKAPLNSGAFFVLLYLYAAFAPRPSCLQRSAGQDLAPHHPQRDAAESGRKSHAPDVPDDFPRIIDQLRTGRRRGTGDEAKLPEKTIHVPAEVNARHRFLTDVAALRV